MQTPELGLSHGHPAFVITQLVAESPNCKLRVRDVLLLVLLDLIIGINIYLAHYHKTTTIISYFASTLIPYPESSPPTERSAQFSHKYIFAAALDATFEVGKGLTLDRR